MAAPHVAGCFALAIASGVADPRAAIPESTDRTIRTPELGYGVIDAAKIVLGGGLPVFNRMVTFDGRSSHDPEGGALTYEWSFNSADDFTDFGTPLSGASPPPEGSLAGLIDEGDFEEAAKRYFAMSAGETRRLLTERHSLVLGNWMAAKGHHHSAALVLFQRHLRDYPVGLGAADAHVGAGLLQLRAFSQPTAAYQHLVEALGLEPCPRTEALARQGLAQIAALQKFQLNSLQR